MNCNNEFCQYSSPQQCISDKVNLKTCQFCKITKFCSEQCKDIHYQKCRNQCNELKQIQSNPNINQLDLAKSNVNGGWKSYNKKKRIESFQFIEGEKTLGQGAFGVVYKAIDNEDGKVCAIKKVNKQQLVMLNEIGNLKTEVKIHKKIDFPHIILLYNFFEDNEFVYISLEFAENGSLFELIKSKKCVSESEAFVFFIQICSAVNYLHSQNIVHRDIKPENILLDENYNVKMCDFGYSQKLSQDRTSFCGTRDYLCPEIVDGSIQTNKVDIWCLGILLYEITHGYTPIRHSDRQRSNMMQSLKEFTQKPLQFKNDISPLLQDFISSILQYNPQNRPELNQMMQHQWIIQNAQKMKFNAYSYVFNNQQPYNLYDYCIQKKKCYDLKSVQKHTRFNINFDQKQDKNIQFSQNQIHANQDNGEMTLKRFKSVDNYQNQQYINKLQSEVDTYFENSDKNYISSSQPNIPQSASYTNFEMDDIDEMTPANKIQKVKIQQNGQDNKKQKLLNYDSQQSQQWIKQNNQKSNNNNQNLYGSTSSIQSNSSNPYYSCNNYKKPTTTKQQDGYITSNQNSQNCGNVKQNQFLKQSKQNIQASQCYQMYPNSGLNKNLSENNKQRLKSFDEEDDERNKKKFSSTDGFKTASSLNHIEIIDSLGNNESPFNSPFKSFYNNNSKYRSSRQRVKKKDDYDQGEIYESNSTNSQWILSHRSSKQQISQLNSPTSNEIRSKQSSLQNNILSQKNVNLKIFQNSKDTIYNNISSRSSNSSKNSEAIDFNFGSNSNQKQYFF